MKLHIYFYVYQVVFSLGFASVLKSKKKKPILVGMILYRNVSSI